MSISRTPLIAHGRVRSIAAALIISGLFASESDAQIIRRPIRREPDWFVSFNAGYERSRTIQDGSTHSDWLFGSGPQYGATLEKTVAPGTTFGVSALFSQLPLSYQPTTNVGPTGCFSSCEATANVMEVVGVFRADYGGGLFGFRGGHEFGIGVTAYSNFREQTSGNVLPPSKTDLDLLLSYTSVFGFGLSPNSAIEFGLGTGFTIHQRSGLSASENTLNPLLRLRVGVRMGLGS